MPVVACGCSRPQRVHRMGVGRVEKVCECGHWVEWHDLNGRCSGTKWSDEGEQRTEGLYSGKVERMPDFIDVNVPDFA